MDWNKLYLDVFGDFFNYFRVCQSFELGAYSPWSFLSWILIMHSRVVSEESDEHVGTSQTHMSPATVIVPDQTLLTAPAWIWWLRLVLAIKIQVAYVCKTFEEAVANIHTWQESFFWGLSFPAETSLTGDKHFDRADGVALVRGTRMSSYSIYYI